MQLLVMQHNWFITGFLLLFWAILLLVAILLNLRTAVLLMPIVLIVLLLYLAACLFFALSDRQSTQETVESSSPKLLPHLLKEYKNGKQSK
jgi:Ca2+/Na+ antiporter